MIALGCRDSDTDIDYTSSDSSGFDTSDSDISSDHPDDSFLSCESTPRGQKEISDGLGVGFSDAQIGEALGRPKTLNEMLRESEVTP